MNGKRFYWDYMGRFFSMTKPNAIAFFNASIEATKASAKHAYELEYDAMANTADPYQYGKCLSDKTSRKLRKELRADQIGEFTIGQAEWWVEFLSR